MRACKAIALVAAACAAACVAQADPAQVVVVPTPAVSEPADLAAKLLALADNAQPRVVTLPKGVNLIELLNKEYGGAAPWMWKHVQEANGGGDLSAQLAPRTMPASLVTPDVVKDFIFPAGPFWILKATTVVVDDGENVEAIARRYFGSATPREISKGRALLVRDNPGVDLNRLSAGMELRVAQRNVARVYSSSTDAQGLQSETGPNTRPVDEIRLVEPLAAADVECKARDDKWPIDWAALVDLLKENNRRFDALGKQRQNMTVAVVDSGIDPDEDGRGRITFWKGGPNNYLGRDVTEKVDRRDISRNSYPFIDADVPRIRNHGTHVAALIHGGAIDKTYRDALVEAGKLMVMKIVATTEQQGREVSTISADSIKNAIAYASTYSAPVLNLSVESVGVTHAEWDNLWLRFQEILFVIAAGNGKAAAGGEGRKGVNFGRGAYAPAHLGGMQSGNVISVAAHDADRKLADFSNFGGSHITLAAPGCEITSFLPGEPSEGTYSGTSQAAPLVTLIASLLRHYGLPTADIKRRLIASVDYVPELRGRVFAEGVLNAQKALHVLTDIVEVKEGDTTRIVPCELTTTGRHNGKPALHFRRFDPASNTFDSSYPILLSDVLKITATGPYTGDGSRARIVFRPETAETNFVEVVIEEGALSSPLKCVDAADQEVERAKYVDLVRRAPL